MTSGSGRPIRVGVIGLGRSGWNIHALTLETLPEHFAVTAVSDPDANRRNEAEQRFGCRAYEGVESLLADDALELIVVASPSQDHAEHSIAAMEAGRDVVCEKPFALSSEEADRVIATSQRTGQVIAPFQNRRYDPSFQQVKRVIDSGVLGRIVMIRIVAHNFSRRWDWQTLKRFGGGSLNNTGPHFLDQALELFGEGEPEVFCQMDRALTLGDADDHAKVILHGEGHPSVEVEITAACAYPQDMWLVMGTRGGLRGGGKRLDWRWVDFEQLSAREVELAPTPDRSYNREQLPWQSDSWEPDPDKAVPLAEQFYRDLYATLRERAPLTITPESVRRQIAVLERCHEMSPV